MAYKLIYNPLIDYIRSHACMYAFARFCYIVVRLRVYVILLTVGWYGVACMQAKSICISTYIYDGIKGGSALVMQAM